MSECFAIVSLKIGEPCVFSTPSTLSRSLIGIGIPASRPRSPTGFFINALAWVRARSKHSVGKALTLPSTSAIRCSSTSSRSSGVTSPEFSFSMTAHAVARPRLRSDATCVSPSFRFLPIRPLFRVGGLNLPVIPGRCEASNPESRDSGFDASHRPGMTGKFKPPTRNNGRIGKKRNEGETQVASDRSLGRATACAVIEKLNSGEVTPLDLLDVLEQRIAEVDGKVNALPTLCFDRARTHAKALMKKPVGDRGLLAGMPIPIKDLLNVEGVLNTQGSPIFKDTIAKHSDIAVERLEGNGGGGFGQGETPRIRARAPTPQKDVTW